MTHLWICRGIFTGKKAEGLGDTMVALSDFFTHLIVSKKFAWIFDA